MRGWLKSKKFWVGAIAGTVAGPAALNFMKRATGVGVSGVANRVNGS